MKGLLPIESHTKYQDGSETSPQGEAVRNATIYCESFYTFLLITKIVYTNDILLDPP